MRLLLAALLCVTASAATVVSQFENALGVPYTGKVTLTPTNAPMAVPPVIVPRIPVTISPASNGKSTNDLAPGAYLVSAGSSQAFTIEVPDDALTHDLYTLIVSGAGSSTNYNWTLPRLDGTTHVVVSPTDFWAANGFGAITYVWPAADGDSGAVLTTDGAGTLTWREIDYPVVRETSGWMRRSTNAMTRSFTAFSIPYYQLRLLAEPRSGGTNLGTVSLITDSSVTALLPSGTTYTNDAPSGYRLDAANHLVLWTQAYDGLKWTLRLPSSSTVRGLGSIGYALTPASGYCSNNILPTGTANFGAGSYTRWFFSRCNYNRVRRTGMIKGFRFWTADLSSTTSIRIILWRVDGSVYDKVSTSEDLLGQCSNNSTNICILQTPIAAIEGDMLGLKIVGNAATPAPLYQQTGLSYSTNFYVQNPTPDPDQNYNWTATSAQAGYLWTCQALMDPPEIMTFGDSILAGADGHRSGCEQYSQTIDFTYPISSALQSHYGATIENAAIGGSQTTNLLLRFTNDVLAVKPAVLLLNGGVNDINWTTTNAAYIATNLYTMLSVAQSAGILPVYMSTVPMDNPVALNPSREYCRQVLKTNMQSICASLNVPFVDLDPIVGDAYEIEGGGGATGYRQKAAYAWGQHWLAAGYAAMAAEVIRVLDAYLSTNHVVW